MQHYYAETLRCYIVSDFFFAMPGSHRVCYSTWHHFRHHYVTHPVSTEMPFIVMQSPQKYCIMGYMI
jgi:hypothetical protein